MDAHRRFGENPLKKLARACAVAILPAIAFASSAPGAGASTTHSPNHWVGSWMAAPSSASERSLSDQTVRMVISPHLSGERLRLHLTNRFGEAPLGIAHATIASDAGDGGVAASSLRTVRFEGQRSVTIQPGAELVSDPVRERVRRFQKLAVSIAVSGTVSAPTEHQITREINYSTPSGTGDHSADASGAAFTPSGADGGSSGWYFLDGLDVEASRWTAAVVAFGDSITDGFQGTLPFLDEDFGSVGKEERYPDYLQRRIDAAHRPLSVLNSGIGGNRLLADGLFPRFGQAGLSRLEADAIDQAGVRTVIIMEGLNDVWQTSVTGGTLSPAELIAGYKQAICRLHRAHLRVLLGTLTPTAGFPIPALGETGDQIRVPVNEWIRSQKRSDGVVDFANAVRDPSDPSRLRPEYDGGDHAHLSPAGYQAMAGAVPLRELGSG